MILILFGSFRDEDEDDFEQGEEGQRMIESTSLGQCAAELNGTFYDCFTRSRTTDELTD